MTKLTLFAVAICSTSPVAKGAELLVQKEVARLRACPAVYKTSPPPIHVRSRWLPPEELTETKVGSNLIRISFLVRYEQSDFFKTSEEADHASTFHPLMILQQRNYYKSAGGSLRLQYREALIGRNWEWQKGGVADLSCWQGGYSAG